MLVFVDECDRLAQAVRCGAVMPWRLPEQMDRSMEAARNAMRLCLLLLEKRSWSAALTAYRLGAQLAYPNHAQELQELESRQAAAARANNDCFLDHCQRTGYRPPGIEVVGQSIARMQPTILSPRP